MQSSGALDAFQRAIDSSHAEFFSFVHFGLQVGFVQLHDIGTGDGIPVLPGPEYTGTANKIRTAPLWALRTRNRLMHDGLSFTLQEAIQRHAGQAAGVRTRYNALSEAERNQVLAFLNSL